MTSEEVAELTPVDHAFATIVADFEHLTKLLGDGGLDPFDRQRAVRFMQDAERLRNRWSVVDHYTIAAAERLDLPTVLCQGSMRRVLTSVLGVSKGEAARRVRAAEAVGPRTSMLGEPLEPVRPVLAAAQQAGEVSAEKVAIIERALATVDRRGFDPADIAHGEALLTEHAVSFPPEDLKLLADRFVDALDPDGTLPNDELNTDRRYFHLRSTRDGAYVGDFRLTGTLGAKLKNLLDPLAKPRIDPSGAVDPRSFGQRSHDALEDICDRQLRAGDVPDAGGIPATVIVTIDADDLTRRTGSGRTTDGTPIPTAKLLQLANNADIIPTVLTASGAVLDLGRSRRIANRPQTMALIARDAGCSFPGCAHPPQYCERHHIREWVDGGLTDLKNLTLLCVYHHHNFLARGWTCRMNTDGIPEWIPPKWVDRDQNPMINTRIQAVLTARKHAQRNKPIIS